MRQSKKNYGNVFGESGTPGATGRHKRQKKGKNKPNGQNGQEYPESSPRSKNCLKRELCEEKKKSASMDRVRVNVSSRVPPRGSLGTHTTRSYKQGGGPRKFKKKGTLDKPL